jgi:hypothetical protein
MAVVYVIPEDVNPLNPTRTTNSKDVFNPPPPEPPIIPAIRSAHHSAPKGAQKKGLKING